MVASTHPMVIPQSGINSHTHMFNAYAIDNSPTSPTTAQRRSHSPSPRQGTRHLTTPTPSIPSTPREVGGNGDQGFHYDVPDSNTICSGPFVTPRSATVKDSPFVNVSPSASNSPSSGLKLKLRGIQAALKEPTDYSNSHLESISRLKSPFLETCFDDDFDTDSEIDLMPLRKIAVESTAKRSTARTASRKIKKIKVTHDDRDYDDGDTMFDAGDEDSSPTSPVGKFTLSTNILKRSERILDPTNPEHAKLIAAAPKAGSDYYDSEAEDLPGNVKETNKPHLFRNVKWGSLATDYSNLAEFTTEPEFTQFVPGRFERLPNGTASDQKFKLIIKLTDKQHRQRIFLNPPPRDWSNQEAITALNKRTVQQIRRNTSIRFREVVEPYVKEEREWILAHLTEGKPTNGWRRFVDEFNREFEGKKLGESDTVRPERSHSSLTKEVERFGKIYSKGVVPQTSLQGSNKKNIKKSG